MLIDVFLCLVDDNSLAALLPEQNRENNCL